MDCEGVGIAISVVSSGRRISLMRQGGVTFFTSGYACALIACCLLFLASTFVWTCLCFVC